MNLLEHLPAEDKQNIYTYIQMFAGEGNFDPNGQIAETDYLLRIWAEAKESLFKLFGNKFILSKEIEMVKPLPELKEEVRAMRKKHNAFLDAFGKILHEYAPWYLELEPRRSDKFEDLGGDEEYIRTRHRAHWAIQYLVDTDCLANNSYNYDTTEVPLPDGKVYKIQQGCRPMRALSKIAEAYGIEGFEDFRLAHSLVLNQKKIKGTLHLSIHPLDYLTMSDNDSNWESCMNWHDAGQYRAGTVEMMNSKSVVVAYISNDSKPFKPTGTFEWNNKKWRQLFVVDNDFIASVKAYPYESQELTTEVINELLALKDWSGAEIAPFYPNKDMPYNGINVNIKMTTGSMYNDFSTTTHFIAMDPNLNTDTYFTEYCYSGLSECMWCGEHNDHCDNDEALVCCHNCLPVGRCSECGELYYSDWGYSTDMCECCEEYEEEFYDEVWKTYGYQCNEISLYLTKDTDPNLPCWQYYSVSINDCSNYERAEWPERWDELFVGITTFHRHKNGGYYYVTIDECTDEGLRLFSVCDQDELERYKQAITSTD